MHGPSLKIALAKRLTSSDLRPIVLRRYTDTLSDRQRWTKASPRIGSKLSDCGVLSPEWACLGFLRLKATVMRPTWQFPPPKEGRAVCYAIISDKDLSAQPLLALAKPVGAGVGGGAERHVKL